MEAKTASVNHLLSETRLHLQTLLQSMPVLVSCLPGRDNDVAGTSFKILEQIPQQIFEAEERPVITVAFCGPSGAGKSTVFNLLTQLGVPAGGAVRPMTHASLAAFPSQLNGLISATEFFPGFSMSQLSEHSELRKPGTPNKSLFYTYYKNPFFTENLWPCLVDIPDFNTTELSNWEKAEQMIRRAESIIFTVYHEAYKDQKTFDILKKVLQVAGNVTWLLTKLDPTNIAANAEAIREDLIKSARNDPEFLAKRTDGKSLADFLAESAFYYSPFSSSIKLDDIRPLANTRADFTTYIFGQKGLEVALKRQLQSITVGVAGCEKVCLDAGNEFQKIETEMQACEKILEDSAVSITGEEFPVFRILELIRKQLEEHRPSFLRRAFQPLMFLGAGLKKALTSLSNAISGLTGGEIKNTVKQRDSLERTRLHAEVSNLVDYWRRKPELSQITTEQCAQASENVLNAELPPIDSEWEASVNASLQTWQSGNKDLWRWMNVIDELFMLLGAGLVVADFFIDGGVGTLGLVAVVGGSSAAGGLLLSLFNNMGLSREVMEAHRNWKRLRQCSYKKHLRELLAGPLFLRKLQEKATRLSPDLIKTCQQACQQLKEISRIHEIG